MFGQRVLRYRVKMTKLCPKPLLIYLAVVNRQRSYNISSNKTIHFFLFNSASHSSATNQLSWRNIRSDAFWGSTEARHLEIVSPATEKTRSVGADVAGTQSNRRARMLRTGKIFSWTCHHCRGSDKTSLKKSPGSVEHKDRIWWYDR
jgi:hypothetical protein